MENIEAMLCAYVEGDLDAAGKAQIEKHLQDHPQHKKLLEELMAMREMVRGLPRAKAPMDVGDSLRQKVERSMLLEDSAAAMPMRQRGERWPQFFGIAAIFLLASSLCFIMYKALGPTWKPAVFTENSNVKTPDIAPQDQTVPVAVENGMASARPMVEAPQTMTAGTNAQSEDQKQGSVARMMASDVANELKLENAQAQSPQIAMAIQKVNFQAIRTRLEQSGYRIGGTPGGFGGGSVAGGIAGAGSFQLAGGVSPVLMVVNTTDVPATKAQMIQFLSNSSGVSWNAVPAEQAIISKASTMPSENIAKQAALNADLGMKYQLDDGGNQQNIDLYVAHGLTADQTLALRQLLTVPQKGSAVQVSVEPADKLASTQPSDEQAIYGVKKDAEDSSGAVTVNTALGGTALTANAATMPSAGQANLDRNAGAQSDVKMGTGNVATPVPGGQAQAIQSQTNQVLSLGPVDAVIVLQNAANQSTTGVTSATTRPAPEAAPSVAAPVTGTPSTQP